MPFETRIDTDKMRIATDKMRIATDKKQIIQISFPSTQKFPVEYGVTTRDAPFFFSGIPDLLDPRKAPPFLKSFPEFKKWIFPEQIHGSNVTVLGEGDFQKETPFIVPDTDGLLTSMPEVTLAILTADCLPIFFLVPDPLTVGIVHAGWRGSAAGIARSAVEELRSATRQSPEKFLVTFGPCIGVCCYQVGAELKPLFRETVVEREGAIYLDLVQENRRQLEKSGVKGEHINGHSLCTACHPEFFFSYRREGEKAGRMVSWIRIRSVV